MGFGELELPMGAESSLLKWQHNDSRTILRSVIPALSCLATGYLEKMMHEWGLTVNHTCVQSFAESSLAALLLF